MGRNPEIVKKNFTNSEGKSIDIEVELFTWEKLDYIQELKKLFNLA